MKIFIGLFCFCLSALCLQASSSLPRSPIERLTSADATGLATLVTSNTYLDQGVIHTRFTFRTTESLHGTLPPYFKVTSPGGIYRDQGNADSRLPRLKVGQTYVLNLRVIGGQLRFADNVAGILDPETTDLPALRTKAATLDAGTNLAAFATEAVSINYQVTGSGLLDTNGFRRFTSPDRGEPIPVYADVSTLPAGISESQAITALQNALKAWENVSTVRFNYLGTQIFSQSADIYSTDYGRVIRVQLHDAFNQISDDDSTLGVGGTVFMLDSGGGGTIADAPFNPSRYGYVVINHPKSALQNPKTLEEVLTHEIGHVIGLAHSSETSNESDSTLAEAVMFFQAHADDRGALLNSHDITTVLKAYPENTPPYGYDRIISAVSPTSGTITNPEVNRITLAGADLQNNPLTIQIDNQTGNGDRFSLAGHTLTYNPPINTYGPPFSDPTSGYYDLVKYRLSDGTNQSPFITVHVVALLPDSLPTGAPDGIPDSWMSTHFGSANGSTASADPDGDGLTNRQEFLLGTDPNDAASTFKITHFASGTLTWTTQRFDNYLVQSSSDLVTWTAERFVTQPEDAPTLTLNDLPTSNTEGRLFFRVLRQD